MLFRLKYFLVSLAVFSSIASVAVAGPIEKKIVNAITQQRSDVIEGGHVYRAPMQWVHYNLHQDIRKVFDGDFRVISKKPALIARMFNAYVVSYSRHCRSHLPENVAQYVLKRRTTYMRGAVVVSSHTTVTERIYLKPSMQVQYLAYMTSSENDPTPLDKLNFALDMLRSDLSDIIQLGVSMHYPLADMETFMNREGCSGPAQVQMEANLIRLAAQKPSVQANNVRIPGAGTASSSLQRSLKPENLAEACAHAGHYRYDAYAWCRCLDENAKAQLSSENYKILYERYFQGREGKSIQSGCYN